MPPSPLVDPLTDLTDAARFRWQEMVRRSAGQVLSEAPLLVEGRDGIWREGQFTSAGDGVAQPLPACWLAGQTPEHEVALRRFTQPGGCWMYDHAQGSVAVDTAASALIGTVGSSTWHDLLERCHGDDRARLTDGMGQLITEAFDRLQVDVRFVKSDGWCWLLFQGRRWSPTEIAGSVVDVSELQLAKAGRAANFHRFLFDACRSITSIFSLDGRILDTSDSCQEVMGYTREEFLGIDGFQFVHPEDQPMVAKAFGELMAGAEVARPLEMRIRHKDGTWHWAESFGRRTNDPILGTVIVAHPRLPTGLPHGGSRHRQRL